MGFSRLLTVSVGAVVVVIASTRAPAQITFTVIGDDTLHGTGIDNTVPAALAADGTVLFRGQTGPGGDAALFSGNGVAAPMMLDLGPTPYENIRSPQVNATGDVIFVADRPDAGMTTTLTGAYTGALGVAGTTTLLEGDKFNFEPVPEDNVVLNEAGNVTFSTIEDGVGAILRGPIAGPLDVLRQGSGSFFNTRQLDMNEAGIVAVQMEYFDAIEGLARGVLLFEQPGDDLSTIDTGIERLSVGVQPMPAINGAGQVAFALNTAVTIDFYDPPDDPTGSIVDTLMLEPGVYLANPTPLGLVSDLTLIAGAAGPYDTFGRVELDDMGNVVFEATLDDLTDGIYFGPDPTTDRIIQEGDLIDGKFIIDMRLGELNNNGQGTFIASDIEPTRRVYRFDGLPEPGVLAFIAVGLSMCVVPRRMRSERH